MTFEDISGIGAPTDLLGISTQLQAAHGIAFRLVDNAGVPLVDVPLIAQVGGLPTAFRGLLNAPDQPTDAVGFSAHFS